jgi:uncharacterized OB-fold protein
MAPALDTTPSDSPTFEGSISLPYKLTAGRSASVFLAELANKRLVGSLCPDCARVLVPAQDFCGRCGAETDALLEMPSTGTLTGFTETSSGLLGQVRIDGSDTDFVHRMVGVTFDELEIGQAVEARWADEPEGSMLDLAGFGPGAAGEGAAPKDLVSSTDPLPEHPYQLRLDYKHAYGPYYGRMFDELSTSRRILGVRCPSCESVLVPPRAYCDVCFVRTAEWVDVADTGVLQAFSVIHLEFVGQKRKPPYVYAEIVLDGSSTRLIHTIDGISPDEAVERLAPGARVRAVWGDGPPTGSLEDIDHFELIEE